MGKRALWPLLLSTRARTPGICSACLSSESRWGRRDFLLLSTGWCYALGVLQTYVQELALVCIDAANLESAVKDLGWYIDYRKVLDGHSTNSDTMCGVIYGSPDFPKPLP
jgi:hypothetical protein